MPLLSEIVVRFAGDVTGLSSAASSASAIVGRMGEEAHAAGEGGLAGLIGRVREFGGSMGESVLKAGLFVQRLTDLKFALFEGVQALVGQSAQMEQNQIAFTTLLKSSSAASGFLKDLWNFAAKTPFQFQNLTQASQMMLAFGYDSKSIIPDLTILGDALSGMGRTDAGSLQQIVMVFGQMRAAGRVNAQDMMQLTTLGISGWDILAKSMHKSVSEVRQLSQQGKLLTDDAIPMLLKGLHASFGGDMAKQALTFNGELTTIKDNLIGAWMVMSGPIFQAAKAGMDWFAKIVASDQFQNFAKVVGEGIGGAMGVVAKAVQNVMTFLQPLGYFLQYVGYKAMGIFKDVGDTLTQVGQIIRSVFQGMKGGGGDNPLVMAFSNLITVAYPAVERFAALVHNAFMRIQAVLSTVNPQVIIAAFRQVGSVVGPVLQQIANYIFNSLLPALAQFVPVLVDCARIFMTTLWPALKQTAQMIMGQVQQAFKVLGPVVQSLGAWFVSTLLPAIRQLMPVLAQLAATFEAQLLPALQQARNIIWTVALAVIPPLVAVLQFIIPIVISLASNIAQGLTVAFNFLGPAVQGILSVIQNVADFFTKNELAADALKGVLVGLAVVMAVEVIPTLIALAVDGIVAVITAIPGIVTGFIAWAVVAWGAAVATIAATWPLLLLVAVIALVVVGIILAVQHWGQIVAWLQGVWGAISSWFAGLWDSIKSIFTSSVSAVSSFFVSAWGAIVNFFKGVWNGIISFLKSAWAFILNVIKIGAIAILVLMTWPFLAVAALFIWLYNHNYYFKALIDNIIKFVKAGVAWLIGAWQNTVNTIVGAWKWVSDRATELWNTISGAITAVVIAVVVWLLVTWHRISTWISDRWNWLVGMATSIWNKIVFTIRVYIMAAQMIIHDIWNKVVGFLQGIWDKISGAVSGVWKKISGIFSSAWNTYIAGPIGDIFNKIKDTVGGWVSGAWQWGVNLIQGFINGIGSMLGNLGNVLGDVGHKILQFLGFHSPTELGAGAQAHTWAPNLMKMFTKGISDGIPAVHAALGGVFGASLGSPSFALPTASTYQGSGGGGGSNNTVHVHNHLYVDGRELTATLVDHMGAALASRVRSEGPVRR